MPNPDPRTRNVAAITRAAACLVPPTAEAVDALLDRMTHAERVRLADTCQHREACGCAPMFGGGS